MLELRHILISGKVVAKFCAKYLHTQVLKQEAYSAGDLGASIQRAFFRLFFSFCPSNIAYWIVSFFWSHEYIYIYLNINSGKSLNFSYFMSSEWMK